MDIYFTKVPSPEEKGWIKDMIELDPNYEEVFGAIANKLNCRVEDLGFCSLYESNFSEEEMIEFNCGLKTDNVEPFFRDEWESGGYTFWYELKLFAHTKYGLVVAETVNDTGGLITNFWRKMN